MSVLYDLAAYLQDHGVGVNEAYNSTNPGTDYHIFVGSRPEKPDDCLTLYAYPGLAPEYVQEDFSPKYEHPYVQVLVRGRVYADADYKIHQAWNALCTLTNASLGGVRYKSVRPLASPALMGRDINDRTMLFFNLAIMKEVSA